jgi:hypothetical protein
MCDDEFICEMLYVKSKEGDNKAPSLKKTLPCTLMQVTTVQEQQVEKMWKVLLDPGSIHSFVKQSILPCWNNTKFTSQETKSHHDKRRSHV